WHTMMWNALQTTPQVDIEVTLKAYVEQLWYPAYRFVSHIQTFLETYVRNKDIKMGDIFRTPGIRKRFDRFLESQPLIAKRIHSDNEEIKAYTYPVDGKLYMVLVNV